MRHVSAVLLFSLLLTSLAGVSAGVLAAQAPGGTIPAAAAAGFLGTWNIEMESPAALRGSQETLTLRDDAGSLAATLQIGRFPPQPITGAHRDGDLLILSTTIRENGQPIWVVLTLKLEDDVLRLAQSMEQSETIKRGTGRRAR